jgi:hydroxymethylglutaryl-CoA synthase
MDTAQGRPGDPLEYTAAAGGAAYIISRAEESLAVIESTYSFVTDTPDFFRRAHQKYPEHGHRFTGEPAYFKHIISAGSAIMEETGTTPEDFEHVVLHQPNAKATGLLSPTIGNTYSGATIIGLAAILDVAEPGDRILLVSFGSGAGSDAMIITVTERIDVCRDLAPRTSEYIARRTEIDYATYVRMRGKLTMK